MLQAGLLIMGSWMAVALVASIAIALPAGRCLARLLPEDQRMLPPRVARKLIYLGALLVCLPAGCRAGVLSTAIAGGDRLAGYETEALYPTTFVTSPEAREGLREWLTAPSSLPRLSARIVAFLLHDWVDALEFLWPIASARMVETDTFASAWVISRPQVLAALARTLVGTCIMTAILLAGASVAIAILFLLVRLETPRVPLT